MRPKRYLEDTQTQASGEEREGTSTAEPAEESIVTNRPAGADAPSNDAAYLGDLLQKIYKREFFSDVPPQFAWLRLSDESLDDAFQRVQLAYDTGGARAAFEEARKASVANWRDGRLGKGVREALPKGCDTAEYEKDKRVAKEVYDKQLKKLHEAMLYALRRALVQPKPKWMQARAKSPAAKVPKVSKGVCGWWEEPNPQQPKDDGAATGAKQPIKPVESEAVGTQTQQEEQGTAEAGGLGANASQQAPAASSVGHGQVQSTGSLAADDDILAHLPRYISQESIDADRRRTQEGEQGVGVGGGGGAGSRPVTTPTPQPQPPPGYTSPDIMVQHAQPAGAQPRAPVSRTNSTQPPMAPLSARRIVSRGESMSMYQRPPVGSMGSGPMHGRVRSMDVMPMGVPSSRQQSSAGSLAAPGTHSRPSTGMGSQAPMQQQQQQQQQRQSPSGSMLSRAGSMTMAPGQPRAPLSRAGSMTVGPLSIGGGSGGSAQPRSRADSITSVPRTVVTSAGRPPLSRAGSLEQSVMSRTSMVPRAPLRQSQVLEPTLLQPQPSAEQIRSRVGSLQQSVSETMRSRVSSAGSVPSGGVPPQDPRSRAGSGTQASVAGGRVSVGGGGDVSLAGITQQQQPLQQQQLLQQQQRTLSWLSSTAPAGSISSSGRSSGSPPDLAMTQPLYTSAQPQPLPLPPPPSTARRPRTGTEISQLSGGSAGSAPQLGMPAWAPPAWEPLPQDTFTHTSPPESIMSHPQRTVRSAGAAGVAPSMSSTMRSATSQPPQQRQSMGGVPQSMNAGASVAPPARAKSQSLPPNGMSVTGGAGSVSSSRHSQGPSISMSQGLRPPWASQTLQSTARRGVDQPTVRQQPGAPPQPPPAPSLSQQLFETIRSVSPVQDMPLSQAEQSMTHQQQPPQADEQNGSVAPHHHQQQHSRQSSLEYSLAPSAAPPPQRQHPSSASVASAARTIDGRMRMSMKSGPPQQLPMAQSVGGDMRDSGRDCGAGGQGRYEDEMDTRSIRSRQPTVRLPPQRIQLSPPPEPDDRSVHTTRQLMQRQDSAGQQSVRSLQPSVMRCTMQPPHPPPPLPQPDEQSRTPYGGGMTQQPMQRQGSMGEASVRSHQPSVMRRTMQLPPPPPPQQPDEQSRVAYDDGGITRQTMQRQDSVGERSVRSHQPSVMRRTAQAQPPPPLVPAEHQSQQGYDEVPRQTMQRQRSMGEASVRSHQPSVMRRTAQQPPPPSHAPAEYQSQQGFEEVVARQTMQRQASMGAASVRSHQPSVMRHTVQQPPPPPDAADQQSQQGFDQTAAWQTMQRQASMGEASIRSHQPSVMRRTAQQPPPPPPPVQAPTHPDQQIYAEPQAMLNREESVVAPSIGTARITQKQKMDDGRRVTMREPTMSGDVGRQTVRREESMDERTLRSHQPSVMRRTAQQPQPPPQQQHDQQQSHDEFMEQQSVRMGHGSMDASVAAPSVRTARHATMGHAMDDGMDPHALGTGVRPHDVDDGVTRQTMQRLESSDERTLRSHQPSVMRRTVQQQPPPQAVPHGAYAEQQSVRGRQDSADASIAGRTLRGATRSLHMTEHGPAQEMPPEVGSMMDARRMGTGAAHQSVRRQESMGEQSLRSHQPSVMTRTAQAQPLQQPPPPTQIEQRQPEEYMQEGMGRHREESVERSFLAAPSAAPHQATQHYEHEPETSTYKAGTQTLQQVTRAPVGQYAWEEEVDERTMRSHQPSVMRRTAPPTAEHVLQPEAPQSYAEQRQAQTYTQHHESRSRQESVDRSFAPQSATPVAPAGGSDGDGRGHYVQQQDDVEERSMMSRQASVMRGPPSQPNVPPPHVSQQLRPEQMEPQEYVEEQSYGMRQDVHQPTAATHTREQVRAPESLQHRDIQEDALQERPESAAARVRDGREVQQPLPPQHDAEAPQQQAAAMSAVSRTADRHQEEYVERERALEEQSLRSRQQPSVVRRTQTQAPPPTQQTQRGLHDDQRSQAQPGGLQAPALRTVDEDNLALPEQRSVQQQQQPQQDVRDTQRASAHVPHLSDGDDEGRALQSDAYAERGLGMAEEPSMKRRTVQAATASVHPQDQQLQRQQQQQQQHDGQMYAEEQSFVGEDDDVPAEARGRPVTRPSMGVHDQEMVADDRIAYDMQDQPDLGSGGEGAHAKSQPLEHRQQRKASIADLGALRPQQRQDVRETSTVAPSQRRRPSMSPRQVQPDVEGQSLADLQQGAVEPADAADDVRRVVHVPQQQQQQQQQQSSSATVRAPPSLQQQPGPVAGAGSQVEPVTQYDVRQETQSVRPAGMRSVTYEDDEDSALLHSRRPSHAIDQATVAASRRMPPRRLSDDEELQAYPADRTVSGARTVSGGREALRRGSIAPSVAASRRPPQSVAPPTEMEVQGGDEMMPYEQSAADEISQNEEVYNTPSGGVAQRSGVSVRQLQQPPSGGTVAPMPSTRSVYTRSQPQQLEQQQRARDGRVESQYDGANAHMEAGDGVDVRGATQPHVRRVSWGGTVSVSDTITASADESYVEYDDAHAPGGRGGMADDRSRVMQQQPQQPRPPVEDRQQGPMSRATASIAPTQRRQPQSLQPPPQPKQQQPIATYGREDQAGDAYSIQQQQEYADETLYVADYGYADDPAEPQAQQSVQARDWQHMQQQQQQPYAVQGAQNGSYPYGEGAPMGGEEYVEALAQSPLDQYHSFEVEPMDGDVYDGQWMDGVEVVADQGHGYYTDDGRAYMQPQQQRWSEGEPVDEQARGGGAYAAAEARGLGQPQPMYGRHDLQQQQQQYHYDQPGHGGRPQSFAISEPTFDGSGYYDDLQQQQTYGPLDGGEGVYVNAENQQPYYAGAPGAKHHGENVYGESAETAFDGMYGDGRMGAEGEETMPIGEEGGWRVRLRGHDVDAVQQTQHGRWRLTIRDGEIEMEDMLPQRQQQLQQLQQQELQQQQAYGVGPAVYDAQDEYDDAAPHLYDDTAAPQLYDDPAAQFEYHDTAPQFVDSYDTYATEPIMAPLQGEMYDYVDMPAVEDEMDVIDGSYADVGVAQSYGGGQQVDVGGHVAVGGHNEGVVRPVHAVQGDDVEKDEQDAVRQELGTIETLLRFVTDGIDVREGKLGDADRQQVPVTLQELESTMASLQVAIDGVVRRFAGRTGQE